MDFEKPSEYVVHEAAREGRSKKASPLHAYIADLVVAATVESLLNVCAVTANTAAGMTSSLSILQANPRLATRKDEDERLPLHWACSYNHLPIVELLVSRKDFDPDVQDGSGWTPLMIASSLAEGDDLVDLLLSKEADVNAKSKDIHLATEHYNDS